MDRYLDKMHSPMMRFFDVIYKLVYLNVLCLLGTIVGLGIFGLYPSLLTLFRVTRYVFIDEQEQEPYWKMFWTEYKQVFVRANILFLLIAGLVAITILDAIFLYQNYLLVDELTVFGVILSLGGLLLIFLVVGLVSSIGVAHAYFNGFSVKELIQFSLFTTFSHPLLIGLYILIIGASYLIFSILISASFFLALSLPIWAMVRLYKPHFFQLFLLAKGDHYALMNIRYIRDESTVYELVDSVRPVTEDMLEGQLDSLQLDQMDSTMSVAVFSDQEELIALLLTKTHEDYHQVETIVVKPEYQRRGIARAMFLHIEQKDSKSIACDLRYLQAQVPYTNVSKLRSFFASIGYVTQDSSTYTRP
jgi:uncharacterized membrane protein YesL